MEDETTSIFALIPFKVSMFLSFGSCSYPNPSEIISIFDIDPSIILEDLTLYFKESHWFGAYDKICGNFDGEILNVVGSTLNIEYFPLY